MRVIWLIELDYSMLYDRFETISLRSYKSAVEQDLFDALQKSVNEDESIDAAVSVHKAFSSWSQQKGYPVLIVERNYDKNTVVLRQSRYSTPKGIIKDNATWWIPYNYATALNSNFVDTTPTGWLMPDEQSKTISINASLNDWILFNKQQTGYYRVLYDEHNYKLLTKQLNGDNFTLIHWLNRAQLLDDSFDFVEQGVLKIHTFLRLFSYLKRETGYAPWKAASVFVEKLSRLLSGSDLYPRILAYLTDLLDEPYHAIGVESHWDETILRQFARTIIVNLACKFGVASCLRATHLQLKLVLFNNFTLQPDLHDFVYANGIRNASDDEVDRLWLHFSNARENDERLAIAASFGLVRNRELLDKYANKTIENDESSGMSKSERAALFHSIIERDEYGLSLGIHLIKHNPIDFEKNVKDLNIIVLPMADRVATVRAREKVSDKSI